MANEGSSTLQTTVSRIVRFLVALLLPAWGVIMIVLGVTDNMGWWIATGATVFIIGVILFGGSSLVSPFLGGRWRFARFFRRHSCFGSQLPERPGRNILN
ncbi:MAG: hypothetical protein ACREQE_09590 [Candidatus Binataceae bacterium]